jgi:hypothetical protein
VDHRQRLNGLMGGVCGQNDNVVNTARRFIFRTGTASQHSLPTQVRKGLNLALKSLETRTIPENSWTETGLTHCHTSRPWRIAGVSADRWINGFGATRIDNDALYGQ